MDENASSAIGSLNRKKPVACPAEGPGGQGPPYFKNAPPLSQGLDDPPPHPPYLKSGSATGSVD